MASSQKIRVSPKGRKCQFPDCKRMLSVYNHELHCNVHVNYLLGKTSALLEKEKRTIL
jgi:hypothetical protein